MASDPENPAHRLSEQGEGADAVQNMRLNYGRDPVFAHLATFATAAAINGLRIELETGRRGRQKLVAAYHLRGLSPARSYWSSPEVMHRAIPLHAGVALHGYLRFANADSDSRVFPYGVDSSLTRNAGKRRGGNQLMSSEVSLERPPDQVYGVSAMKLGVIAVHTKKYSFSSEGTSVKAVNETHNPAAFKSLLDMLERSTDLDFPDEEQDGPGPLLTRTHVTTGVTTIPTAHFDFHEALGVPPEIVDTARMSFRAIAQFMHLPYTLPDKSPPEQS